MNWDKLIDLINIDVNDSAKTIAGTLGTLTAWALFVYTILGDVVIPALQQAQGLLPSQ
jgi:hypothetical protein